MLSRETSLAFLDEMEKIGAVHLAPIKGTESTGFLTEERARIERLLDKMTEGELSVLAGALARTCHQAGGGQEKQAGTCQVYVLEAFREELGKIASVSQEQKRQQMGAAALGAGGATAIASLFALRPMVYVEQAPDTNKVTIYYSDPRRGAGHKAQGEALAEALRKQGADVSLVNFDMEFVRRLPSEMARDPKTGEYLVTPKALAAYNDSYDVWAKDPGKERFHFDKHHEFYMKSIDEPKLSSAFKANDRKVLANIGLQLRANEQGKPLFLLHTDQHPWDWIEFGIPGKGNINRHIAARSAASTLLDRHPHLRERLGIIPDLAIKPPSFKGGDPFKFRGTKNITVSGGNLGVSTPDMVRELLRSGKLPEGTVIHAVAGKGTLLPELEALEQATAGKSVRVAAYGFAPLPDMMNQADLNVMRPHGTSITEATAAGKPLILYVPPDGARPMDRNNIKAMFKSLGVPAGTSYRGDDLDGVDVKNLGDQVEHVLKNYEGFHARMKEAAPSAMTGADAAARDVLQTRTFIGRTRQGATLDTWKRALSSIREHGLSRDMIHTGLLKARDVGVGWSAARLAVGAAGVGAAGTLAYKAMTPAGPPVPGLQLLASRSDPRVRRWQRPLYGTPSEREKAASVRQERVLAAFHEELEKIGWNPLKPIGAAVSGLYSKAGTALTGPVGMAGVSAFAGAGGGLAGVGSGLATVAGQQTQRAAMRGLIAARPARGASPVAQAARGAKVDALRAAHHAGGQMQRFSPIIGSLAGNLA